MTDKNFIPCGNFLHSTEENSFGVLPRYCVGVKNGTVCISELRCNVFLIHINIKCTFSKTGLTHYHTITRFDALKIYSCGKHCEKFRNCL